MSRFVHFVHLLSALVLVLTMSALPGCGAPGGSSDSAAPAALNHTHDLLILRDDPRTVLLATHYALYRSTDGGAQWRAVAGEPDQPMSGLMIYKLAQSPINPQRLYALAVQRSAASAPARPGAYTSADGGAHWTLATPLSRFPNAAVYTLSVGAAGPEQLFVVDSTAGAHGLFESDDAGAHWRALPALPTSDAGGLVADAQDPARLWLWSRSSGLFQSADAGETWAPIAGITGGVYGLTQAGALCYAPGDAGLYVSSDDGATFQLVDQQDTFTTVIASASAPRHAYALGGTAVYTSLTSGATWTATASLPQHPSLLAVDPTNALVAFVASSYPVGVLKTSDGGQRWSIVFR